MPIFRAILLSLVFAAAFAACKGKGDDDCTLADNKATTLRVDYGRAVALKPRLCNVGAKAKVEYAWTQTKELVSTEPTYTFLACPQYVAGSTQVRVDLKSGSRKAHHAWNINVRDVEPNYQRCSAGHYPKDAVHALQSGDFYGQKTGLDFKAAVACLEQALTQYPCDIDVAFWMAYGSLALFTQHAPASFFVSGINEKSLNTLIDDEIDPLITQFDLLAAEMPDTFVARPKSFPFSPLGAAGLNVEFGGEWDRGDMYAIDGAFQLFKGVAKFAASYIGSIHFLGLIVNGGLLASQRRGNLAALTEPFQNKLINSLDQDPAYLVLYPGKEGLARMAASRAALITGFARLNQAVTFVKSETDDQRDDKFRYFDCGADSVCPPDHSRDTLRGDAGERLLKDLNGNGKYDAEDDSYLDSNGNGLYNPPWKNARADDGEADGKYTSGETIGTDVFSGLLTRVGLPISDLTQEFMAELALNIKGPNALDLGKFLQLSQSDIVQLSVLGGINVPELRLSRWFEGPRSLRDFLPLWNHQTQLFITDSEEEPFDDWGLDKKPDGQESSVAGNPRCLAIFGDFSGDNFRPDSNPGDDCDNDWDDVTDETDQAGRSTDLGTEGNQIFDFMDTNLNGSHDPGELSESWSDFGLVTGSDDPVGDDNSSWDAADMFHKWPQGNFVGGRVVAIDRDPRNGTLQDGLKPLVDPLYYFFPDAQFNGVLMFATPTINADNVPLTDNAEFMRFISKLVQSGRSLAK